MKKAEVLSPAGSMESLIAAIEGGCDAVYLSGTLYGARSYAANFNNEELKVAVDYAHLYGVRVYVTINILIYESEVKNFLKYIEYLQEISVDAVIVQDIGMMDLLRQKFPSLEIHASTQMHIHNLEGAKFVEQMGLKRAVLARETPIELIKEIKDNTNIDLEIFVHGALCISYSGQCLMSSLIGGRSGNRGTCAQCCRQPYSLIVDGRKVNNDEYLLSTKDLNTLDNLEQLLQTGVDSLKIEGRMKRPEYVYMVTKIYRKAVDNFYETGNCNISKQDIYELKKLFNRQFTKGFIFTESNENFTNANRPNHLGVELGTVLSSTDRKITIKLSEELRVQDGIRILMNKEDYGLTVLKMYKNGKIVEEAYKGDIVEITTTQKVSNGALVLKTSDLKQINEIQNIIKEKRRRVKLTASLTAKLGFNIKLTISDGINIVSVDSDYIVEESKSMPTTKNDIIKQVTKLGNTVYSISDIDVDLDENIFIPVKALNDLRRLAIEEMNSKRLYQLPCDIGNYERLVPNFEVKTAKSITVSSLEEYQNIKDDNFENIYFEEDLYNQIDDDRKYLKLSRVLETHKEYDNKLLVGELGSINKYEDTISDFSLNVVNSYSIALLHSMGVKKVTLSYELNDYQIEKMINAYHERYNAHPNLELIVSGKIEAMIMKYKLLTHYNIHKKAYLKDKYSNNFLVEEKNNLTYIYHFDDRNLDDYDKYYQMGINWLRF